MTPLGVLWTAESILGEVVVGSVVPEEEARPGAIIACKMGDWEETAEDEVEWVAHGGRGGDDWMEGIGEEGIGAGEMQGEEEEGE